MKRIEVILQNYLLFSVGNYRYGLKVNIVKEIIRISAFKPIPDQPLFVEGIINLRGSVIPLVDFRRRFLMGITEKSLDKRIIVCKISEFLVSFLVDTVEEVFTFGEDDLKNVTNEELGLDFKFIDKVAVKDDDLISLLNADRIFSKEEITNLLSMYTRRTQEEKKSTDTIEEKKIKPKSKPKPKPKPKAVTIVRKNTKKPVATPSKPKTQRKKKKPNA